MTLAVALLLAIFVLDEPWDVLVVVGALVLEVGEIFGWMWYTRRRAVQVGAETLIGVEALVLKPCRPGARCASRARSGTHIATKAPTSATAFGSSAATG